MHQEQEDHALPPLSCALHDYARSAPEGRSAVGHGLWRGEGAKAPPRRLRSGASETDDVPYVGTQAPGHLRAARIPYPPTRTPVFPLPASGSRVGALLRQVPAKPTLLSGLRMAAFAVPPTRTKQKPGATAYRTVRQMLGPSGGSRVPRREPHPQLSTKYLQIVGFVRCLVPGKDIPYPPTSLTVPSDKPYRTAPQNIPYPATKLGRNVPAKLGKHVGGRSERPVCVSC